MLLSLRQILMQTIFRPDIFDFFLLQIIFFLMLMKEYVFVSRNFLLLHKLKKGRRLNLCQLFTCWTLVEPSQMIPAILVDQLQQGKEASVSRNIVHLFVSKLCWPQAQQYLVPLLKESSINWSQIIGLTVGITIRGDDKIYSLRTPMAFKR